MKALKEGDAVKIVTRAVTDEDRKKNRYFAHMAGLTGTVQNVYADEVAISVDIPALTKVTSEVHKQATLRMRERFVNNISEEQKRALTKEEMEFDVHYVLLVAKEDVEDN
jgi:ribosomal protein L21E